MVEITWKKSFCRLVLAAAAALPVAGWLHAQPPTVEARIAGLEGNEEYMSLLREDALLQQREDSVGVAVESLRRELRENPAERQRLSQDILRLESRIFEVRTAKGRLIDRINAIEQEWVLTNLDGDMTMRTDAAERDRSAVPDSLKRRNLVDNPCFREQLPAGDYAALREAQRLERHAVEYAERYFANHATLGELAAAYAEVPTEAEALELYGRYDTLRQANAELADSLSEVWTYIFDNKSYAYGYMLDLLGRDDLLAREEERLAEAQQQLASLRGRTASDKVVDYFLRRRVSVGCEKSVAGLLGLDAARDSLEGVDARLAAVDYRLPKIELAERLFLDYDSVAFSATPKYTYQNPIPECRIYERGTIYRILLGTFNTKRAAATFRGAYPLFYLINDEGKWCYYTGGFATREEAGAAQELLKKHGFARPEVVVWNDGAMRNLSRDPEPDGSACRIEISGTETLSEAVRELIRQQAEGCEISRAGAQTFVIGTLDDRAAAERLAEALRQTEEGLKIKVVEAVEKPE